jgi:hypothetical protein
MFTYEVEIPGKGKFRVESPSELTEGQAYQAAMQQSPQPSTTQRVIQGMVDPLDAAAQLLPRGLEFLSSYGGYYENPVSRFFGEQAQDVQRGIQQRTAPLQQEGIDFARMAGNIISPANVIPATRAASGAATPLAASARVGATGGVLTPVESPDSAFGEQKLTQIATGAVAGPVLEKAGGIIAPRLTEAAQKLKEAGVRDLTPGQAFGGALQKVEQGLESIPWVGELFSGARARNIEDFNRAAYNRVLANLGEEIPSDKVGRNAYKYVDTSLSREYDKLVPKLQLPRGTMVVDGNGTPVFFERKVADILSTYRADLPDGVPDRVGKIVENYLFKNLQKGDLTGRQTKQVESIFSHQINKMFRSPDVDQKAAGEALLTIQAALRDAIEVANPQFRGQLQPINRAWAELSILKKAAQTGQEGVFSPAALLQAAKSGDTSRGRTFARGEARMQDLAEAAKQSLGQQIPDSGSAFRGMVGVGGLAGMGGLDPTTAAATATASLGYSKQLQPYMAKLFTERPELMGLIGSTIRPALPYLTPGLLGAQERR